MFFKITKQNADLYNKLNDILIEAEEKKIEDEKLLSEAIPYKRGEIYYGSRAWQGFSINIQYKGLSFEDGQDIDPKVWINKGQYYIPNSRTKKGKEMRNILYKTGDTLVFKILDLILPEIIGRFTIPRVYHGNECLVVYVGEDERKHVAESLEEITTANARELTGIEF